MTLQGGANILDDAAAVGRADSQGMLRHIAGLADQHQIDIELGSLIKSVDPFEQANDSELVRTAEQLTGHQAQAVAFATEAPFLQQLGMETIVMGPGSIDRAHQPDEYLELDQIGPCIELLSQCIRHYCL